MTNGYVQIQGKILCRQSIRKYVPYIINRAMSDFIEVRRDTNKQRMKTYADDQLLRRYLKDDAVPSIFPNTPSYLSSAGGMPRSTTRTTAFSRREQQAKEFENLA